MILWLLQVRIHQKDLGQRPSTMRIWDTMSLENMKSLDPMVAMSIQI